MFPSAGPQIIEVAVRPVANMANSTRRAAPSFAVVDLPGRQFAAFRCPWAQINHVVEVNFLLRLARDLQNDDPPGSKHAGPISFGLILLDRLPGIPVAVPIVISAEIETCRTGSPDCRHV